MSLEQSLNHSFEQGAGFSASTLSVIIIATILVSVVLWAIITIKSIVGDKHTDPAFKIHMFLMVAFVFSLWAIVIITI